MLWNRSLQIVPVQGDPVYIHTSNIKRQTGKSKTWIWTKVELLEKKNMSFIVVLLQTNGSQEQGKQDMSRSCWDLVKIVRVTDHLSFSASYCQLCHTAIRDYALLYPSVGIKMAPSK